LKFTQGGDEGITLSLHIGRYSSKGVGEEEWV
jgi:hypothetical protein